MNEVDRDVVDLNVVRLARLVASIERTARWCEWQARADEDEAEDDVPLTPDEKVVLEGWCQGFAKLAKDLHEVNRMVVPDAPLEAVNVLRERIGELIRRCDVEVDAGLERCDTIPDLLGTQGRLHALRVARRQLEGLRRSESEPPAAP